MLDPVSSRFAPLTGPEQRRPITADAVARPMPAAVGVKASPTAPAQAASSDLARTLSQSPPVDSSRVAELRHAMQAGTFPVQADRIADAMISSLKG